MTSDTRPLAIVTGASAGIGYELAKCCAEQGFDLPIAADQPAITKVGQEEKDDPADVAKADFEAMMQGDVITG
jgi:short-subunit dehydrogenase